MKKTVQVILLPADRNVKTGDLFGYYIQNKLHIGNIATFDEFDKSLGNVVLHLYFIYNEGIKKGDWYINKQVKYLFKASSNHLFVDESLLKVIATTDKSLGLPLIPQSFVEEYVKSNGEIKEVEIDTDDKYELVRKTETGDYIEISKPKKQTLEEAAEEYKEGYSNKAYHVLAKQSFLAGAKWQQSQG